MTTLIYVGNSSGCVGRCDAKCYGATTPECDCICGGANHGKGLAVALEQTREVGKRWIAEWEKAHPGEKAELALGTLQESLGV